MRELKKKTSVCHHQRERVILEFVGAFLHMVCLP